MSLKSNVEQILNNILSPDMYIVEVNVSESKIRNKVSVFIDTDEGIGIDECAKISYELGQQLDELTEAAYTLEVSSPGADSPLKFERQYIKNIGRNLKVVSNLLEETKGQLIEVINGNIVIQPESKKKVIFEPITISINDVKEAKVILSFK